MKFIIEETMDREKSREQRAKKRRKRRIIKSVFWIAVLGVAAWFFLFGNDMISFSGIRRYFSDMFTSGGSSSLAVLNGTSVQDVHMIGNDMMVLSDIGGQVLNKNGGEIISFQHGCTNPAVTSDGNRFLVFDRDGLRYEIYNKNGLVREGQTEYPIIDAAIAANGSYVIVSGSKSYHNEAHYYNSAGEETYVWYSADNYIYKAAIKGDGKRFAVLGMNANGGEVSSYAFIFDPASKAEPIKIPIDENICYAVSYKGSSLTVIGRNSAYCISSDGELKNTYAYGDRELKGYADTDSRSILVFSKYGVGRDHTIVSLDSSVKEKKTADIELDFRCVTVSGKNITVLGSHEACVYSTSLSLKHTEPISADGTYAYTVGKNIFVFGVGNITKFTY